LNHAFGSPARALKTLASGTPAAGVPPQGDAGEATAELDDEGGDSMDTPEESGDASSYSPKPRKKAPEKVPDIVDIDRSKQKKTLAEYIAEKKPDEGPEQVLVGAWWLKYEAGITAFTVEQIFTLLRTDFKAIVPAPRKLLSNMKVRRLLSAGPIEGTYSLNALGESTFQSLGK